jgi:hypothetical protein
MKKKFNVGDRVSFLSGYKQVCKGRIHFIDKHLAHVDRDDKRIGGGSNGTWLVNLEFLKKIDNVFQGTRNKKVVAL